MAHQLTCSCQSLADKSAVYAAEMDQMKVFVHIISHVAYRSVFRSNLETGSHMRKSAAIQPKWSLQTNPMTSSVPL